MVRALLGGRKTQTRRVMKDQPDDFIRCVQTGRYHPTIVDKDGIEGPGEEVFGAWDDGGEWSLKAPYKPGDLLWVRETWGINHTDYCTGIIPKERPEDVHDDQMVYFFTEDDPEIQTEMPKRPSIHMPRWASRLTLRVTNVRAERLQDISEDDARAEGVRKGEIRGHTLWSGRDTERPTLPSARQAFLDHIWTDLYGEHETKSVGANPWVWVYEFEVIRENIDRVTSTNPRQ